MASFDIKTATIEELKKKEKSNKQLAAFFIGLFVMLIIVNIITSIVTKKIHFSTIAVFIFIFCGIGMQKSNKEINDEIKLREQMQ
jgi:cell division protein FtsW (lipid II flippase)